MSATNLPLRYASDWRGPFDFAVDRFIVDGVRVLDIGSGRSPALLPDKRPLGVRYVGLDVSRSELAAAGPDAYDSAIATDIADFQPDLVGRFDLAISWQVLEHVDDVSRAVANIQRYLRRGGAVVAFLSGRYSVFATANRLLPDRIGHALVTRIMKRQEHKDPVFRAHYDRGHATALRGVFAGWRSVEVIPFYRAAGYFAFSPGLQRLYLRYENLVSSRGIEQLATHYLVVAST